MPSSNSCSCNLKLPVHSSGETILLFLILYRYVFVSEKQPKQEIIPENSFSLTPGPSPIIGRGEKGQGLTGESVKSAYQGLNKETNRIRAWQLRFMIMVHFRHNGVTAVDSLFRTGIPEQPDGTK